MKPNVWSALAAVVAWTVVDASTLTPPVLPLVVRNPYLSTWLPNARQEPWNQWPIFWTGKTFGFGVLASIPESNSVYPLLGSPQHFLNQKR